MANPSRPPRQPEQVRARLLAASTELLSQGVRLSIGAVAEQAGVSKGAVQHHFGTRDELLAALYDYLMALYFEAASGQDGTLPAAMRYAQQNLDAPPSESAASAWRAMLVALVVERDLASWWADWVQSDREQDAAGSSEALLVRLAADGLWLSDILGIYKISKAQRRALRARMRELLLTKGA